MQPKEIFSLAVRLLGLYFLFAGLKDLDVQTLMDVTTLKGESPQDIISAILPAVFNLAIAWWLLGSTWLMRRAYSPAPKISNYSSPQPKQATPVAQPVPEPPVTETEEAEKKLAALLRKPKDSGSA
jgi:hypothetical protein